MRPQQRPPRRGVVEGRRQERHCVVTVRAIRRRERGPRRRVHRIVGPLPAASVVRIQVALGVRAIGRLDLQVVIVVDMAVGAGVHLARRRHLMRIGQRETCGGVVKTRGQPRDRIVAVGASRDREHRGRSRVLRIRGLLPGRQMATRMPAIGGCNLQVVVAAHVATCARNTCVSVGQREIDWRRSVVDACAHPAVERVAAFAGLWELSRDVVGHTAAHRLRLLVVLQVTRGTGGREPLELADRRTLVTILTLHRRMRPQQREPVLVILYLLHGDIPALHRVALRAIRAHLFLVHVGMAILAVLPHIRENRLHMALRALHFFVHAPQRILRFIVVKLGNSLDGPPSRGRVTVLTRNCQLPVRTTRSLPLRRWSRSVGWPCKQQEPA